MKCSGKTRCESVFGEEVLGKIALITSWKDQSDLGLCVRFPAAEPEAGYLSLMSYDLSVMMTKYDTMIQ